VPGEERTVAVPEVRIAVDSEVHIVAVQVARVDSREAVVVPILHLSLFRNPRRTVLLLQTVSRNFYIFHSSFIPPFLSFFS